VKIRDSEIVLLILIAIIFVIVAGVMPQISEFVEKLLEVFK